MFSSLNTDAANATVVAGAASAEIIVETVVKTAAAAANTFR